MSQRTLIRRLWYRLLQWVMTVVCALLFRLRVRGREQVPQAGGVLILSSHQSHLDPILVGVACRRQASFLARETLFHFAPLAWLIRSLNAIPIDREGSGLGGLKETLRRLKRGEVMVIFPEGTRTVDGQVGALKPGFTSLVRRAKVPIVPMAIEGAFRAWPRQRRVPRPARIAIQIGAPVLPEQIAGLDDEQLVRLVTARIVDCQRQAVDSMR